YSRSGGVQLTGAPPHDPRPRLETARTRNISRFKDRDADMIEVPCGAGSRAEARSTALTQTIARGASPAVSAVDAGQAAASAFACAMTSSSIAAVRRPVNVFCWLG